MSSHFLIIYNNYKSTNLNLHKVMLYVMTEIAFTKNHETKIYCCIYFINYTFSGPTFKRATTFTKCIKGSPDLIEVKLEPDPLVPGADHHFTMEQLKVLSPKVPQH